MQQSFSRSSLVPSGFVVESAYHNGDRAIITVRPSRGFGLCPSCGMVSRRVHSHYRRRVTDLPPSGRALSRLSTRAASAPTCSESNFTVCWRAAIACFMSSWGAVDGPVFDWTVAIEDGSFSGRLGPQKTATPMAIKMTAIIHRGTQRDRTGPVLLWSRLKGSLIAPITPTRIGSCSVVSCRARPCRASARR